MKLRCVESADDLENDCVSNLLLGGRDSAAGDVVMRLLSVDSDSACLAIVSNIGCACGGRSI